MTIIMTRCYDSIQATIILLDYTALLVPTLFWPYILYFQASYKASGSINIACISHLDSFDRITHSLLLTRLVSLLQVTSPPPALVTERHAYWHEFPYDSVKCPALFAWFVLVIAFQIGRVNANI